MDAGIFDAGLMPPPRRSWLRLLLTSLLPLVLVGAGWYTVIAQSISLERSTIASYQATQTEIVESAARAASVYMDRELRRRGAAAIPAIEQEVLRLFIQPIRIGQYGDAWIYHPDYAIFDRSADFPEAFLGLPIDRIFALRRLQDPRIPPDTHLSLVANVRAARAGVTTYVWDPDKAAEYAPWWEPLTRDTGWEIASWTTATVFPDTVGARVWVVGMSTMLPEVMTINGAYRQIHLSILTMVVVSIAAVAFLWFLWRRDRRLQVLELQRLNAELTRAYDTTIGGLARVLEWRDAETEGHCQRVTALTLRLGRAMGMGEAEMVHLRRGAILHDIGKLAIPDSILLKPGPLDQAERAVIERHPEYAHAMLAPVPFLRPALAIPHYHHERWDGGGYPAGLRGEQIPLAARLFAVVDVYDALRSDRPYRQGWSHQRVCQYLREHAGSHFDPRVVAAFLQLRFPDTEPLPPACGQRGALGEGGELGVGDVRVHRAEPGEGAEPTV